MPRDPKNPKKLANELAELVEQIDSRRLTAAGHAAIRHPAPSLGVVRRLLAVGYRLPGTPLLSRFAEVVKQGLTTLASFSHVQ